VHSFYESCSVGVSAGVGSGGNGPYVSYDSKKGVKFDSSQRIGGVGPVTVSFRDSTPGSKASGAVTVRDPVTGLGIGGVVDEKGQPSVKYPKGPFLVGANATLGTIGDPKCRVP
jgi:hypothetical protein